MFPRNNRPFISKSEIEAHQRLKENETLHSLQSCLLLDSDNFSYGLQDSFSSQHHLVKNIKNYIMILQDNKLIEREYDESGDLVKGYTREELDAMATTICKYAIHVMDQTTRETILQYKGGMIGKFLDRAEAELDRQVEIEIEIEEEEYTIDVIDALLKNWEEERLQGANKSRIDEFGKTIVQLADSLKHIEGYRDEVKFDYINGALSKYMSDKEKVETSIL